MRTPKEVTRELVTVVDPFFLWVKIPVDEALQIYKGEHVYKRDLYVLHPDSSETLVDAEEQIHETLDSNTEIVAEALDFLATMALHADWGERFGE